jgi:hypothetical protein
VQNFFSVGEVGSPHEIARIHCLWQGFMAKWPGYLARYKALQIIVPKSHFGSEVRHNVIAYYAKAVEVHFNTIAKTRLLGGKEQRETSS